MESDAILIFDSVSTTEETEGYDLALVNASFSLSAGELGLFQFDRQSPRMPLADMAMGLVDVASGKVRFMNDDWQQLSPGRAAARRGEIGRLFGTRGWVYHLDVEENVTLSQRHHTRRPLAEIEHEAIGLASTFGLQTGLPQVRPALVDAHDLQRAACVRLFIGSPRLLIVDEPPTGLFPDILKALKPQIQRARSTGTSVLWISADTGVWNDASIEPTFRGDAAQPSLRPTADVS